MKLKEFEAHLQRVRTFNQPKIHLEQFITNAHLASQILFNIDQRYDDINGKIVCDLGCGTGMLSIASSLMDAQFVLGIDIDSDALQICRQNLDEFALNNIDLLNVDCKQLLKTTDGNNIEEYFVQPRFLNAFDTVIMNPPFGTKNQANNYNSSLSNLGIDMQFLKLASILSRNSIYSLHKSVTRDYIKKLARKWNLEMEVVCELRYDIPKIDTRNRQLEYTAAKKDIQVDLLRFTFQK
jgi:predicted RNA methylase